MENITAVPNSLKTRKSSLSFQGFAKLFRTDLKQVLCSLEPRKLNRLSNYENANDNCSTSGTMGGV